MAKTDNFDKPGKNYIKDLLNMYNYHEDQLKPAFAANKNLKFFPGNIVYAHMGSTNDDKPLTYTVLGLWIEKIPHHRNPKLNHYLVFSHNNGDRIRMREDDISLWEKGFPMENLLKLQWPRR